MNSLEESYIQGQSTEDSEVDMAGVTVVQNSEGFGLESRSGEREPQTVLLQARDLIVKMRLQRDHYRLVNMRLSVERDRAFSDMKRMKIYYRNVESEVEVYRAKYENAMKHLSLARLARNRSEDSMGSSLNLKAVSKNPPFKSNSPIERKISQEVFTPLPCCESTDTNISGLATHKELRMSGSMEAHSLAVSRLSVWGSLVATASDDCTSKVLELCDSSLVEKSSAYHGCFVSDVALHPTAPFVFSALGDGRIDLRHVHNDENFKPQSAQFHRACVWFFSVHGTGTYALSGSMDKSVKLIDLNLFKSRSTFRGHSAPINSVVWFHDTMALTGSADCTVGLFDVRTGRLASVFREHRTEVESVVCASDEFRFTSADSSGLVCFWDVRNVYSPTSTVACGSKINNMHQANEALAIACADGSIRNFYQGQTIETGSADPVLDCKWLAAGGLVAATQNGKLLLFDAL